MKAFLKSFAKYLAVLGVVGVLAYVALEYIKSNVKQDATVPAVLQQLGELQKQNSKLSARILTLAEQRQHKEGETDASASEREQDQRIGIAREMAAAANAKADQNTRSIAITREMAAAANAKADRNSGQGRSKVVARAPSSDDASQIPGSQAPRRTTQPRSRPRSHTRERVEKKETDSGFSWGGVLSSDHKGRIGGTVVIGGGTRTRTRTETYDQRGDGWDNGSRCRPGFNSRGERKHF